MTRATLIRQPRLRNPDTVFIPHHIRLDDKGLRTSPMRTPYRQKLADWWVFDDGRAQWTHGQIINSTTQRLFSRTGSGRFISGTASTGCRGRFLSRTYHNHAGLSSASSFLLGFDFNPTAYVFTPTSSFTWVVAVATRASVVAAPIMSFMRAKHYTTSTAVRASIPPWEIPGGLPYRIRAHEPGGTLSFSTVYTTNKTIEIRGNYTESYGRALPLSMAEPYYQLHVYALDFDPVTNRFTMAHNECPLTCFPTSGTASSYLGVWNVPGDTLTIHSMQITPSSGVPDDAFCFYEIMLFQPRLKMHVRGAQYSYYRGDEFEELVHGYFVPRYGLHRNWTQLYMEKASYMWPIMRRYPGDSVGLPRLCPGWLFRYTTSRAHPYGLIRLGPEAATQVHNRNRAHFCYVDSEPWTVGSTLSSVRSMAFSSLPITFEQK